MLRKEEKGVTCWNVARKTEKSTEQTKQPTYPTETSKQTSWQHDGLSCLQNGLPKETQVPVILDARQQACQKSQYSSISAFLIARVKLSLPRQAFFGHWKENRLRFTQKPNTIWASSTVLATQKGQQKEKHRQRLRFLRCQPQRMAQGFMFTAGTVCNMPSQS